MIPVQSCGTLKTTREALLFQHTLDLSSGFWTLIRRSLNTPHPPIHGKLSGTEIRVFPQLQTAGAIKEAMGSRMNSETSNCPRRACSCLIGGKEVEFLPGPPTQKLRAPRRFGYTRNSRMMETRSLKSSGSRRKGDEGRAT